MAVTLDPKERQRLRLHRLLLASTASALYVVALVAFYTQGKIDRSTLLLAGAFVAAFILLFFILFRYRINLRSSDPSLTGYQVTAAMLTMLLVFYRAPDTRLVFAAFFFVALMFGLLRSSGTQLTILGCASLAGFALVSLARYAGIHDAQMLREDMLQLIVTAIAFPWFVLIGSRVKRLNEADRRKDEFLATLAHELRNPLAPIRTGVHIMRLTGAEASAQSVLPMMERQLQHLTRLLDDLLDVSRITRGKIALHVEPVDLGRTVQAALEACRPLIDKMGHELTVSLPPEPVTLDADPVRLAQIVSNLLNNAAKYTPPGGRIALHVERQGGEVEIRVTDNGTGIAPENLRRIFDMFTQVEGDTSQAQGGLGIGLALVKGFVVLHGGSVEARSDGPGRGSEFCVRLPVRSTQAVAPAAPAPGGPRRAKLRILVVDDNLDAAESLSLLLRMMGHEVRAAHDGEGAVQLGDDFNPQAVLLDIGMPGIDGYETCRRMRARGWGRDAKIIAVTGWGQDEDRRKSAAAGFDEHLVKPVDAETLARVIDAQSVVPTRTGSRP